VITDGIDFVFCMTQGGQPTVISLVEKNRLNGSNWSRLTVNPQFEVFMRQFFANPSPQQCDEGKLVELVALRTRLLADDIEHYASIPEEEALNDDERRTITLLSNLRQLVYNHNDETLRTEKVFADFTAQVVMFCLLYAHRVLCQSADTPVEKETKIRAYISEDLIDGEALLPFRNLMIFLRDNADTGAFISQWVDECIKFLSFVQMTDFQLLNPDYHKLFELFLSKYDAQSRFDYGAYYTPKDLAAYVVQLTSLVVRNEFDGASIYDEGNTIIDPCCGTGSFLEQVIAHDPHDGHYNLCGFEIMPAPYMLANYRMAVIGRQMGERSHNTSIILANTLSNCVFGEPANEDSIEGHELQRASHLSSLPLKLIIGNPPCSDSMRQNTTADFSIINGLMDDFRPPVEGRRARQNTQKQVNNPYMQFLRWSCKKLLDSHNHSVLSFVVPLSFLEAESYRYARKFLSQHFSTAYIIAVDADARTGVRNDSLFHTLQGRAIIILTHKYGEPEGLRSYNFLDYSCLNMADKLEAMHLSAEQTLDQFTLNPVTEDNYSFAPSKPFNEDAYNKYWPVSGEAGQNAIFINHCSGIKLAPTAVFTHVKAPMLKRRSKEIATGGAASARPWFAHQDRPPKDEKIEAFQTALNGCGNAHSIDAMLNQNISQYSFRPFLLSNVLLWKDLLQRYSKIGGGGTRLRPEIIRAYSNPDTIGFAMAHAPKDLNPTLSQFVSFCWYYPDNDMCTRGNSHIYVNQYPTGETGMQSNINATLLHRVMDILAVDAAEASRQIVFYSYAILCSQVYLDEFEGALFTVNQSDKRARIPIVSDRELFRRLAELGKMVAELEKAGYQAENILQYDYDAIAETLPAGFHLSNAPHPFDEENEQLILSDGHTEIRVFCPIAIQHLNVSGYDVIKNVWLKFNSYDFTHCELTRDDVRSLLNLLNTLAMQSHLVAEIDATIYPITHEEVDILRPDV